ncbi:ATP-dependent helicase [Bacillus coagulans]|nr:ATP-dependent helicase [Heyndrickxia coagulans]
MKFKTKLLPHQVKAVEKLSKIKVGALFMEQGTGKTRTALELAARRYNVGKVDHILWLCPCSVKRTIQREIQKHAGVVPVLTICGIETLSSSTKTTAELRELVMSKKVFIIVDESSLVKNHRAKRTERITMLAERCQYRLILNGTPISKNETDLFSQFYILDWRILGYKSFWSFAANHIEWDENIRGKIRRTLNIDYLVEKIAPYTYQVKKSECLKLPGKYYSSYYYDLTEDQREHYSDICSELLFQVDEYEPHTLYRLFTGLQNVISGFLVGNTDGVHLTKKPFFKNRLDNPRMKMFLYVIGRLDENEKAIIFCKYTQEINDIVEILNDEYGSGSAVPFNGELNQKQRQTNIDKFEKEARFFVANKMTAGFGLNLQFCSCIIYYSNDWDYETRAQSEDRVHRIGQQESVTIIDIIADRTLDERIVNCLYRKENLLENFKYELEQMKDNKDLKALEDWIDGGKNSA